VDSDGDGVGDNGDVFPDDDSEWADRDGDDIGDNADVDADGNGYADCPVGTTEVEDNLCLIPSEVRTDLTLTYLASIDMQQPDYLLNSRADVGKQGYIGSAEDLFSILDSSVTLTLEPGVHVRATSEGSLHIARGSMIHAQGTPALPITFSSVDEGEDGAGEWRGIGIGGFSSVFSGNYGEDIDACVNIGENESNDSRDSDGREVPFNWCNEDSPVGNVGGDHLSDNSGVLAYVRILEAGRAGNGDLPYSRRTALNLAGVGHATQISNVQIKGAAGNGIRLWGGTVNLSRLVIVDTYGSDIDVQGGYKGNIQYIITKKPDNEIHPDIRAGGSLNGYYLGGSENRIALSNVTALGGEDANRLDQFGNATTRALNFQDGVMARLYRSAISGFDEGCVGISTDTVHPANVAIEYAHGDCEFGFYPNWSGVADTEIDIQTGAFSLKSNLAAGVDYPVVLGAGEPIDNGSGFTFEATDYIGAVSPYDTMPWWSEWLHTDVEDDNCPLVTNPDQVDTDFNGRGDACDPIKDDDDDLIDDSIDNCPLVSNPDQLDDDQDGVGNVCDSDADNDGVNDVDDAFPDDPTESADTDLDGVGNEEDLDDDNDGIDDSFDNCPLVNSQNQNDTDEDGIGDVCDVDNDNDGVEDSEDAFPNDPTESLDTDGDGIGNNADTDDDDDGVEDTLDEYPNDPANFTDTDGDGVYDFYDADPDDPSKTKVIRFAFQDVDKAGVSESLSSSEPDTDTGQAPKFAQIHSFKSAVANSGGSSRNAKVGPDLSSELGSVTNLVTWNEQGFALQDTIESNESMFVAESVLTPSGEFVYLLTSPSMQQALSGGGRLELQIDTCQLYRVDVETGKFDCLLDENDPEINTVLKNSVWRDDFLRAGISFRSDGTGVLESSEGPMVLHTDGSYELFNATTREAQDGYIKDIGTDRLARRRAYWCLVIVLP
jgi:hypothetical protein